ncbi:MAG: LuxR family transcriptional regulator [Nitrospirae bacterium]|nr:MAG: LuxR family transcriptional regulator [Nitrospirota bacterium]
MLILDMRLNNLLSKKDLVHMMDLVHRSLSCNDESSFRFLFKELKGLFPHEHAMCLMAVPAPGGGLSTFDVFNSDYPAEWISSYFARTYCRVDPIVKENFARFPVQYWDDTYKRTPPPKDFLSLAADFGLTKGYTYGRKHCVGAKGSLFSFCGPSVERHPRNELILEYLIPHFHRSFAKVLLRNDLCVTSPLSDREKEILEWVKKGKSNSDIAIILDISENTVKYHMKAIMRKLDTRTRPQAIAVALHFGLIDY